MYKTIHLLSLIMLLFFIGNNAYSIQANTELNNTNLAEYQKLFENLKINFDRKECDIAKPETCEMAPLCKRLQSERNELILYKNSEGQAVSNFPLTILIEQASACAQQTVLDTLGAIAPFSISKYGYNDSEFSSQELINYKMNLMALTTKETPRVSKAFEDTKSQLILFLENKKTSSNKSEIENIKKRISAIKLTPIDYTDPDQQIACVGPNAYYQKDAHEITICPTLLEYPTAALESVLAHELAHGIDTCALAHDFSKSNNPNTYPVISSYDNPFKETIKCFENKASMSIKPSSVSEIEKQFIEYGKRLQEEQGLTDDEVQSFVDGQMEKLGDTDDKLVNCSTASGASHIRETFSDWISAGVLEQKLNSLTSTEQKKKYAFESQLIHLATGCDSLFLSQKTRFTDALTNSPKLKACYQKMVAKNEAIALENKEFSHPTSEKRINRIYMTKPGIQKAFGCKPNPEFKDCP